MVRFSKRYGYTSVRDVLQLEFIDDKLMNGLWSALYETIIKFGKPSAFERFPVEDSEYKRLLPELWRKFYKLPIDEIPLDDWLRSVKTVRRNFYEDLDWFEVYDLLEFIAQNLPAAPRERFVKACNEAMQQELAGYHFVESTITRITSEEEIAEIEQAINETESSAVSAHLKRALDLLSDRTNPDYRNSIKESISSVEELCTSLTNEATLGQALKRLDADGAIKTHPALNGAFQKLYGYTSDAGGIRHALLEEDSLDFEDAKFMLVSCSAFVNYLQAKALKTV
jgi:hypothetical protein